MKLLLYLVSADHSGEREVGEEEADGTESVIELLVELGIFRLEVFANFFALFCLYRSRC